MSQNVLIIANENSIICFEYNKLHQIQMMAVSSIQYMGMLMSRASLQLSLGLELVQILNRDYFECQHVITIMSDIFTREKSGKILLAVEILQFLVKNCNKNFHQAANKESFQKLLLGLLKRVRGKSNFLKDLRSNSDNWNKIEAKVLYLVQLWYDAFILEESVYNNIINTYKTLRKENIMFPPRSTNQKNLLFVKTESPILENIQDIARQDHQKFRSKLTNMGLTKMTREMEMLEQVEIKKKHQRMVDVDELSERIAIVRSNGCRGPQMLQLIEEIKKDLQFGVVDVSVEIYWKEIKQAGESVINQWQQNNAELIKQYEREYIQAKFNKKSPSREQQKQQINAKIEEGREVEVQKPKEKPKQQVNLLDL